jgi:putative ABC transport system permease protein
MTQELSLSARRLLKTPSFTALALLCIALGIGANVAVFSVLSSVLLRPLPFADAGRLAMVSDTHSGPSGDEDYEVSPPNYAAWKAGLRDEPDVHPGRPDRQTPFSEIAAWQPRTYSLTGTGEPERIVGAEISADLFQVLGVAPRLGRVFSQGEDTPPGVAVAILSDGLWRDHFGADPEVLRRQVRLDGKSYVIAGVMPPRFDFPDQSRLWTPLALDPYKLPGRQFHTLYVAGRLRPGTSHPQAQLAMESLARELARQFPDSNAGWGVRVKTMREHLTGEIRPALLFLQGAVCLVLLIACVNVANLMLARFEGRRSEFAVRAALGETRRHLVRQLLVESSILSFAGGALGIALAWFGLRALLPLIPPTLLPVQELSFDASVLGYALLAILLVNAIIGLVPAFTRSESDLRSGLGEDGRKASAGRRRRLLLSSLVVAEIAVAMTLLVAAGLLTRSFLELQRVHLGYDPENLLTMRIAFPEQVYTNRDRKIHLLEDALAKIEALPGVKSAAVSMVLPVGDEDINAIIKVEGRPQAMQGEVLLVHNRFVSPHYFRTLRIPLLAGRGINESDRADTQLVVVVSKAMAKAYWPGQNPIGKRVRRGWANMVNPWFTVVGVVDDVQDSSLDAKIGATWYLAFTQTSWPEYSLVVRTAGKPETLAPPVRRILRSLDPELPVGQVKTMEQRLSESLGRQRFSALLLAIFTGLGLILAAAGLYGLMSYSVRQRTHELGVRMALGARRGTVLSLVLRQGTLLVAAGLVMGAVLLVLLVRLIESFLFNVSPVDPLSVGGAAVLLFSVALLASLLPAVRATRIDLVDCFRNQ